MSIALNHTIVHSRDRAQSAVFFDRAFTRITDAGVTYYADPLRRLRRR